MHRKLNVRLSPASVLALIALFAALGGTGYAAVGQLNGKDIKNKSIAGKKLKNRTVTGAKVKGNTLTGKQINEAKLGTVPSATAAATATNAANAANVSGRQRAFKRVTATPGANLAAALAAAPENELFKVGPLTVYAKCITDSSAPVTHALTFVKTSQDGAVLNSPTAQLNGSPAYLTTGTPEMARIATVASATPNTAMGTPWLTTQFTAMTPTGNGFGSQIMTLAKNGAVPAGNGVYGEGNVCLFSGQLEQFN